MSLGLLALIDDVALLAKLTAASLDDLALHTLKAGSKAAGVVIDDAAVTPRFVTGFAAEREWPILRRIALGSLRNKLLVLLPGALALGVLLPGLIPPLLMIGGAYLAFEGTEKLMALFGAHRASEAPALAQGLDPQAREAEMIKGAIRTDFILSAEIMAITLGAVEHQDALTKAAVLALVGIFITLAVYGAVALLVKVDDVGLWLARRGRTRASRAFGRGLVHAMPKFFTLLGAVGLFAMLWVGGGIVAHALDEMGWPLVAQALHGAATWLGGKAPLIPLALTEGLGALVFGLGVGLALVPPVHGAGALMSRVRPKRT